MFSYLFNGYPGKDFEFYPHMIALFSLLVIGSIVFNVYYNKKKKEDIAFKRAFRKTASRLFQLGALFALLTVFRYENIPYFSMRILLYLSIGVLLYFAYHSIKVYRVDYPADKAHNERRISAKSKNTKSYSAKKKRK
jgi:hypothetical protein